MTRQSYQEIKLPEFVYTELLIALEKENLLEKHVVTLKNQEVIWIGSLGFVKEEL